MLLTIHIDPSRLHGYHRLQHRKLSFSSTPALVNNATPGKLHEHLLQPLKTNYGEYSLALSMHEAKWRLLACPLWPHYAAHRRTQVLVTPGRSVVADISIPSPEYSMQILSGWHTSQHTPVIFIVLFIYEYLLFLTYSRPGTNQKAVLNPNPPRTSSSGLSPALENRGQCYRELQELLVNLCVNSLLLQSLLQTKNCLWDWRVCGYI